MSRGDGRSGLGWTGAGQRRRGRRIRVALAASIVAVATGSCVDPFLGPEPGDDPVAIFDLFWSEIDAYYAGFAVKPQLDWDAVRDAYRPQVTPGTAPQQLSDVLGAMIEELQDGHADLNTRFGSYGFDPKAGHPVNYDGQVTGGYLTDRLQSPDAVYEYGWAANGIGYVRVSTMGVDGSGPFIDTVLEHLAGAMAMIIDVRSNGGGSDTQSDVIASRFFDRRRLVGVVRYRNGPDHGDFTDPIEQYLEPAGPRRFTGPVALLTNRGTFSTAEGFVVALNTLPHVLTVGDSTGGGSGNPIRRELPNRWQYRIPRWVAITPDGYQWEGVGLPPDIDLGDTDAALDAGVDPILERAVAELTLCMAGDPSCRI